MSGFEYRIVAAPRRRGMRALEEQLNAVAAEGWEYHRADTLPAGGLLSRGRTRTVLVFRRPLPRTEPLRRGAGKGPVMTPGPLPWTDEDVAEGAVIPLPPALLARAALRESA